MRRTWKRPSASRILKLTALLLMGLWLTSCATAGSCDLLTIKEYDEAFTMSFASQYDAVPDGTPLDVFVIDSRALRQAVRACKR